MKTVWIYIAALFMCASLATSTAMARNDQGKSDKSEKSGKSGKSDKSGKGGNDVNLQILAINDFHGNIATSSGSFGGTGRADFLAANIQAAEEGADNSIFVSAGDLIGASPLISALFHDEPTIEVMNLLGLDINGVGNHEFDEGPAELLRMQNGGSHPVDGDLDGDGFAGADFEFLSANVVVDATGKTLFPAYTVRNYQGVRVAFIGMTLEGTPSIVTPAGTAGLTFNDEVETVNALVRKLRKRRKIRSFVVLLHEGGFSDGGQSDCGTGWLVPSPISPQRYIVMSTWSLPDTPTTSLSVRSMVNG